MNEYADLDKLIEKLEEMVNRAARPIIGDTSKDQWDDIFELMPEIQGHFKTIHYPKKIDRETAWNKFNNLRSQAFECKNHQYRDKSKEHHRELMRMLDNADYNWRIDSIAKEVLWGEFRVRVDTMKARGIMLKEAGNYFRASKHEMTLEHKFEVHEKFVEVRENHDVFWNEVREYNAERAKIREEKQQAWEEKQEKSKAIKERIKNNLQKNKERLEKAEEFLERLKSQRDDLEEKISNAWSDSYRERHEEWLSEKEDKTKDVEAEIEKYNDWIKEDEEKLDNWSD